MVKRESEKKNKDRTEINGGGQKPRLDEEKRIRSRSGFNRTGWKHKSCEEKLKICMDSIIETNFVTTMNLTSPAVNTESISHKLIGANYSGTFKSVGLTLLNPGVTSTVYKTGSVVLMGVNSAIRAIYAAAKLAKIIEQNVKPARYTTGEPVHHHIADVSVHNVVGTVLAFPVDADKMLRKWGHAMKSHSRFTGITLLCSHLGITPETNIVMTIYADSGKIIITGAKDSSEIPPVYEFVHKNILQPAEIVDVVPESAMEEAEEGEDEDEDEEGEDEDEEEEEEEEQEDE